MTAVRVVREVMTENVDMTTGDLWLAWETTVEARGADGRTYPMGISAAPGMGETEPTRARCRRIAAGGLELKMRHLGVWED